jgi:hypothetical protein
MSAIALESQDDFSLLPFEPLEASLFWTTLPLGPRTGARRERSYHSRNKTAPLHDSNDNAALTILGAQRLVNEGPAKSDWELR